MLQSGYHQRKSTPRRRHSFSFGQYRDPANTHYSELRVINDDWVAPAQRGITPRYDQRTFDPANRHNVLT